LLQSPSRHTTDFAVHDDFKLAFNRRFRDAVAGICFDMGDGEMGSVEHAGRASTTTLNCACFLYVLEGEELRLWVWKHTDPKAVEYSLLHMGERIAKLLAEQCAPIALANETESVTPKTLDEWSQNHGETFIAIPLLSRKELVGIIHLQHHQPHVYTTEEIKLLLTASSLVAADINLVRLQAENSDLLLQLETRKLVERGKGILQRDLGLNEEQAYQRFNVKADKSASP
jgi:GAF domain-containing protein